MGLKTIMLLIVSFLTICIGLYLFVYSIRLSKEIKQSKSWPFVKGEILEIGLFKSGGRPDPSYDVDLKFTYEVLSKKYYGNVLT